MFKEAELKKYFQNKTTKTEPYFLHLAGHWGSEQQEDYHPLGSEIVEDFFRDYKLKEGQDLISDDRSVIERNVDGKVIKDLTLVTFSNYPERKLTELAWDALGLNYYVVGQNYKKFDFRYKYSAIRDHLREKIKTPYFIFCDSNDVLTIKELDSLTTKFKEKFPNTKWLFNAEGGRWPGKTSSEVFEFEEKQYAAITDWHYLNSGLYIVETDYFFKNIDQIINTKCNITPFKSLRKKFKNYLSYLRKGNYDDQEAAHYFHMQKYPEVKIDSRCELFQVSTHLQKDGALSKDNF